MLPSHTLSLAWTGCWGQKGRRARRLASQPGCWWAGPEALPPPSPAEAEGSVVSLASWAAARPTPRRATTERAATSLVVVRMVLTDPPLGAGGLGGRERPACAIRTSSA